MPPPPANIPKRSWLKQELESLIAAGQSGDQLPTYVEMLQRYQVGQGTVDYVVLQLAAEGKIERRKGAGLFITSLAKQRSIGLVYEWNTRKGGDSPLERRLVEKIREHVLAQHQHCAFYLHIPFEDQLAADRFSLVSDIEAGRLEGLILIGSESEALEQLLVAKNIPNVGFSPVGLQANQIAVDYPNLIEQGVNALAYSGSSRIGLITTYGEVRRKNPEMREDIEAFQAALSRNRIEFIEEAVMEHKVDVSSVPPSLRETPMEFGYWATTRLFEGGEKNNRLNLDGLVILDDHYTQGALLACEDLGLQVQADVKIATHAFKGCTPLKYRAKKMILLETDPDAIVDAIFRVLEKWTIQGIKPLRSSRLPVTLRLPGPA